MFFEKTKYMYLLKKYEVVAPKRRNKKREKTSELENIIKFKLYLMKKVKSWFNTFYGLTLLLGSFLVAQEIPFPKDLSGDYIFTNTPEGYPKIIVKDGYYQFKKNWIYKGSYSKIFFIDNKNIPSLRTLDNQKFIALKDSLKTFLVLAGGGHVFSHTENGFLREDSSVEQKNQFSSTVFLYNNQIYMYGGYGFWSFKDYITFFDKATGQWEILKTKSEYIPQPRWKAISHLIKDKLYVLGGRNTPKESDKKDIVLNDIFYFDFIENKFINLGEINPKIPLKYSFGPSITIKNKKAYLQKDKIVFFDFKKDTVTSYFQKNLFEGLDMQRPAFEHLDTIYYIKKNKETSLLVKFPIKKLNNINPTFFPMLVEKKNYFEIIFTLLSFIIVLAVWTCFKLFAYKDFLKESLLFDENKIHFRDESYLLSKKQLMFIKRLEKHKEISATELNNIISSKNYVKSHMTLLRSDFINKVNDIYKKLTKSNLNLVEVAQDPFDNRYKIYRTTKQVSEKESFFTFLFRV